MVRRSEDSPNRISLDKHSLLMERTHLSAKALAKAVNCTAW
jgi:hypothetical protein